MLKIKEDLNAFACGGGMIKKAGIIICNPCFHAVLLFRISHLLYKVKLSPLSKIVWYINRMLFHVDIDYRADLAGGFSIIHGLGIVIGKDVMSRGKLTVYQGVTIGGSGKSRTVEDVIRWQPILGENVILYSNSMVLGPVIIQDNSIIKAGNIVTKDI